MTDDWQRNLAVAEAVAAAVNRYAEAAEALARATERQVKAVEKQTAALERNTAQLAKRPKARIPYRIEQMMNLERFLEGIGARGPLH